MECFSKLASYVETINVSRLRDSRTSDFYECVQRSEAIYRTAVLEFGALWRANCNMHARHTSQIRPEAEDRENSELREAVKRDRHNGTKTIARTELQRRS